MSAVEPRIVAGSALRYEIVAGPGAKEVRVEASFPAGITPELSVDSGAEPFVRDVEIGLEEGAAFQRLEAQGMSWIAPSCASRGCRIRYRFLLADAASALGDVGVALAQGGAFLAPPSTWLLYPLRAPSGMPYQFRVTMPAGISFVTGVFPNKDGAPRTYGADISDLPQSPYSAFGPMREDSIQVPGGTVRMVILPGELSEPDDAVRRWVADAADSVARYYGRFPVRSALVMVLPKKHGRIGHAKTLGNGGASIVVAVGQSTDPEDFARDWVMTHEMIHLSFPNMPRRHLWLEEGIATYVEPLARVRLGKISPETMWRDLVRGLPQGLPAPGDRGLDRTPTWGRTYWGGALFCLLADIAIRERTSNRRSLDDALRAIVAAGGTIAARWPLERALEAGDRATGVPVLRELHAKMGQAAVHVDLPALWARLGVRTNGYPITFDDTAPLAAIRRSMTEPLR